MEYLNVVAVVLGLVSLCDNSNGLSTYPVSQDGQTPVLAAVEGAMNVMVFCEVTFNNGNPTFTNWILTRVGGNPILLDFDINGTGIPPNSENFIATGVPVGSGISRSNLTILTFDRSLNMALLECAQSNTVMANFTLRIICMFKYFINNNFILSVQTFPYFIKCLFHSM